MATRRASIAALLFAIGWALEPSSAAYADADAPPVATIDDPSPSDTANESFPGQQVPIGVTADVFADTDPSALTDFRTALDPHGTWVQDPMYGTMWTPSSDEIGADFMPYVSAGHWAYDGDYAWVSDYTWGWVAFHYGRWQWIPA
jgi:hypothetical protein